MNKINPSTLARWRAAGRLPQEPGSPEDVVTAALYAADPQVCDVRGKARRVESALRAAGMLRG